jgi:hypothetical protein
VRHPPEGDVSVDEVRLESVTFHDDLVDDTVTDWVILAR